jgi:hypothetical protein
MITWAKLRLGPCRRGFCKARAYLFPGNLIATPRPARSSEADLPHEGDEVPPDDHHHDNESATDLRMDSMLLEIDEGRGAREGVR